LSDVSSLRINLIVALLAVIAVLPGTTEARIIHKEQSLYSTVLLDERGSTICLQFSVRQDQRNQSCKDRNNPRKLVFGYARMMMASLLLQPNPKTILIVGLGGGTLPTTLNEIYPEARIDVIEIDPAVVTVAETYFEFRANDQIRVFVQDGRVFTKRAAMRDQQYDLIMLDAFNGDYIPEHLMTREYLQETKSILTDEGVVVANTFAISRLYDHESATYQAVFGEFFNVTSRDSANRIIIATGRPLPSMTELEAVASALASELRPYDVRIGNFRRQFSTKVDWDSDARLLTDQYAPANLLREE
jgi:spermidine synthase